ELKPSSSSWVCRRCVVAFISYAVFCLLFTGKLAALGAVVPFASSSFDGELSDTRRLTNRLVPGGRSVFPEARPASGELAACCDPAEGTFRFILPEPTCKIVLPNDFSFAMSQCEGRTLFLTPAQKFFSLASNPEHAHSSGE